MASKDQKEAEKVEKIPETESEQQKEEKNQTSKEHENDQQAADTQSIGESESTTSGGGLAGDKLNKKRDRPSTPRVEENSQKVQEAPPATKRNRLQDETNDKQESKDTGREEEEEEGEEEEEEVNKERRQGEEEEEDSNASTSKNASTTNTPEGSKVTAIRRQVADMTTEDKNKREQQQQESDAPVTSKDKDAPETSEKASRNNTATSSRASSPPPKQQLTFASFSSQSSPFASVPTTSQVSLGSQSSSSSSQTPSKGTISNLVGASSLGRQNTPTPPSPTSSVRAEAGSVPPSSKAQSTRDTPESESKEKDADDDSSSKTTASSTASHLKQQQQQQQTPSIIKTSTQSTFSSFSSIGSSPFAAIKKQATFSSTTDADNTSNENTTDESSATVGSTAATASSDVKGKRTFGEILRESNNGEGTESSNQNVNQLVDKDNQEKSKTPELTLQPKVTGEEDEDVRHTVKCKIFALEGENWKERGLGNLKVLSKKTEKGISARLLMRTDATFRLVLNLPLFPGQKIDQITDRYLKISGIENGKLSSFTIKVKDGATATKLIDDTRNVISDLENNKKNTSS